MTQGAVIPPRRKCQDSGCREKGAGEGSRRVFSLFTCLHPLGPETTFCHGLYVGWSSGTSKDRMTQ